MQFYKGPILGLWIAAAVVVAAGCESTPETPPMDQPIDVDTALDVDSRMRQSTDELLEEHQSPDK